MTSPAFSFYAKDWLAATLAWPLEARGAYVTLLAYQWDAGSIPAGDANVARLLGVSVARARQLWTVLGDKFVTGADGHWRNPRLEVERAKQREHARRNAENGAKGGRPKNPEITQGFAETEPNTNPEKSLSSSSSFSSALHSPLTPQRGTQKKTLTRFASLGGRN